MDGRFSGALSLTSSICALLAAMSIGPRAALAQDTEDGPAQDERTADADEPTVGPLEEIIVFGRGIALLGSAEAASEGSVGGADLLVKPMLRTADLLEAVPGMVAVQHSGSGKANQYFLRGFNLDHGTDFTTYVDGVPWNFRSHGHGQGYLDINGLLPEIVDRLDYRKGTYRADVGDFSMAASSFITTIDRLDAPFVALESGHRGWGRLAAGGTTELGDGTLTALGEVKTYDGPWQHPEGLEHTSVWAKYLRQTSFGDMSFTLSGYEGDWHPTEQVPERAIGTSVCADAFCTLDPTAGGNTSRWIGGVQLGGADWDASGYLQYYDWHMQSNPTYDAQINQFDKRWIAGGRYDRTLIETERLDFTVGGEFRHDDIGPVGVEEHEAGRYVADIANNNIGESSVGFHAEASWAPTGRLRLLAGARADYYKFDVTANRAGSFAGSETDSRVSPKFGLAYAPSDNVELYGNWGKGFHSNDARGVVNAEDPLPGLAPGTGYEAGARLEFGGVKITSAYWWLNLDSELIFVGDSNSVEPRGASERDGYELTVFWQPLDWLGVDAVYTGSNAHYVDNPDGRNIEGSVEHAGQIGFAATKDNWEASLRMRYLGPYALVPDNSERAGSETTISLRGAYTLRDVTFYADLINVLDADGKDIVYWYEAHVAGLDPPGLTSEDIDCGAVNCRMSRAQEPRTLRVGVKWQF
ncbi:TonB-dependent receptor [Candidatus Rariloculus sp.]|uniref:TonB-dependent receptor n=1 Tax=Candidatus Rariloculus sp. TaxID=3101265 RepID=UPI003D0F3C8C